MKTMEPLPTNPTLQEVLDIGRESLSEARSMIESVETEGEADASLKAFLLRVAGCLESLFDPGPVDEAGTRIVAHALNAFLPVLDLAWLPAGGGALTTLSNEDRHAIALLRRERETHAEKRAGKSPAGTWDPLIDVISESIEIFAIYGYKEGFGRCIDLLDAIEEYSTTASRRRGSQPKIEESIHNT